MVNMNELMKKILLNGGEQNNLTEIDPIVEKIVNKTKLINNCVIYDKDGTLKEEEINFERIIKFVGNWTGYEVSCNEFRFSKKAIPSEQFLNLAKKLHSALLKKYNGRIFAIVISLYDEAVDLRFHTYRENEGFWLNQDLNKYDSPILYFM